MRSRNLTAGLRDQIQFAWNGDLDASISFRAAGHGAGDLQTFELASQTVLQCEELEFAYHKLGGDQAGKPAGATAAPRLH